MDESFPAVSVEQLHPEVMRFLLNSADFISQYAAKSQIRLHQCEMLLTRLEINIELLCARTENIPLSMSSIRDDTNPPISVSPIPPPADDDDENDDNQVTVGDIPEMTDDQAENPDEVMARNHKLYSKYFRLINLGVPLAQLKQRMSIEGLDPSILDKPTKMISRDR